MNVMQAVHQVYGMQPRPCNKVSHVKSQGIMSGRHPPTVDATAGTHPPTHPPWTPPHVGLYIVHKHRTAGEGQQQGRSRAVSGQLTKSYRSGLGLSRCLGPGECLHSFIHTVRTYVHTYIHTYVHTYIRTYICTYIHTYVHCLSYAPPLHLSPAAGLGLGCRAQLLLAGRGALTRGPVLRLGVGRLHRWGARVGPHAGVRRT